jgi:YD repeat-containing protein
VAADARGKLKCPAKLKTAKRDDTLPVDDVVGVRPGLSYDEAVNVVLCSHELLTLSASPRGGFRIQTYGQTVRQGFGAVFAEDRINKTSKEIMAEMQDRSMARSMNKAGPGMEGGTARWYVTTMGMPGEERVIAAARVEAYIDDKAPTLSGVGQALVGKYGVPTSSQEQPDGWAYKWAYDSFNRKITETSPLYSKCYGLSHPDNGVNLSPDCGVVVEARILPRKDNPSLASTLQVGVVNKALGYEALMATEQGLERMEQDRRAAQVREASKQAAEPTL